MFARATRAPLASMASPPRSPRARAARPKKLLPVGNELSTVPLGVQSERGWRVLKVHGPFVLSEIGVLASLATPLAEAKISFFAVSTFDTDYLLVASETLSGVIAALEGAGHTVYRSKAE